jgi:hypothetical protein
MTPIDLDLFEITDETEYHVHPSQLLLNPTIEYARLDHGGLGYKVLNSPEVDDSVKSNQLYKCLQNTAPSSARPQSKGKNRRSKSKKR